MEDNQLSKKKVEKFIHEVQSGKTYKELEEYMRKNLTVQDLKYLGESVQKTAEQLQKVMSELQRQHASISKK